MTKKHISLIVAVLMVLAMIPMGTTAADRAYEAPRSGSIPHAKDAAVSFDFETEPTDWTFVDSDGDNFNWEWQEDYSVTPYMTAYSGEGLIYSASYDNDTSTPLTPDNWAITPAIELPSDALLFSFFVEGQDSSYYAENYAVYAGLSADPAAMTKIADDAISPSSYVQRNIDISAYAGKTVYFAIRHYNVTDMFYLNIDLVEVYGESDIPEPTPTPTPTEPPAELQEGYARIILTVGDVWSDGSGYQMLIDADANAYGSTIPTTGGLNSSGNVSDSVYAQFEYKIPTDADGALDTTHIVLNSSYSIDVPAGVYDWCITNPTPGDRMWIASAQGNVGGRQDDYEFIDGCTYEFVVSLMGSNDGVNVTITGENAPEIPVPLFGWYFESDAEFSEFTLVDSDGDGRNWKRAVSSSNYAAYEGTGCVYSASYWSGSYKAYTNANNYIITPAFKVPEVDAELTYYAKNYSSSYMDNLTVYVGATAVPAEMTVITATFQPANAYTKYTIDLSAYAGQTVYVGFQHTGNDKWALMMDQIEVWGEYNEVEPTPEPTVEPTPEPTATPEPVYYDVTFVDGLTNEVIVTVVVEEGAAATAPDVPEHEGYTFTGWDADFSNVTENMTVTALYEVNTYTLTIIYVDDNNNEVAPAYIEELAYGASYEVESPEVEGYTPDVAVVTGVMGAANVEYKVVYTEVEVPPAGLLGDVNNDGDVTMADVSALIAYIMNSGTLTEEGLANADANNDGTVDILDATAIYAIAFSA